MRWLTACTKSATSCTNLLSTWWSPHFHMATVSFQFPSLFWWNFESGWFEIYWESTLWTFCRAKKRHKISSKYRHENFIDPPVTITSRSKFDSTASRFCKSWIYCWYLQCIWIKSNSPKNSWIVRLQTEMGSRLAPDPINDFKAPLMMNILVISFSSFGVWWNFEVVLSDLSWAFCMVF